MVLGSYLRPSERRSDRLRVSPRPSPFTSPAATLTPPLPTVIPPNDTEKPPRRRGGCSAAAAGACASEEQCPQMGISGITCCGCGAASGAATSALQCGQIGISGSSRTAPPCGRLVSSTTTPSRAGRAALSRTLWTAGTIRAEVCPPCDWTPASAVGAFWGGGGGGGGGGE